MELQQYPKPAEEAGDRGICHWHLLVQAFGEVVHDNKEVLISGIGSGKWASYINHDSLEQCPQIVLLHEAPTPCIGPSTSCTDVTFCHQLLMPLL